MKAKLYLFVVIGLFLLSSCGSSILDEKIDPVTLPDNIAKIKKEMPNLDASKTKILNQLKAINDGPAAFQSITAGEIVDNDKFDMYQEQLFNYFLSRETTYKQLFDEVEIMNTFDEKYGDKLEGIYQQIDVFCNNQQNNIEAKERQVEQTIAKLSKMVNVNIMSINKSRYFQHESVEVLAQITNTVRTPIEAIDFNLYISKGGRVIAKLPIHMNDRFVSNKIKKLSYSRESYPAIFNALKNTDIYSITLKEEVYKINLDGETTDAYEITRGLKNHHYKSSGILKGECPYLATNDELYIELQQMLDKKEQELADATPNLEKLAYITESLIADQS